MAIDVAILRCPRCGGGLRQAGEAGERLECGCGAAYPVAGGIPRFVRPSSDGAARRCAGLANVALLQGSLLEPPFAPQSFDLVFSKGVVHCTPDPPGAVRRMAELVKPGGYLFVWVYPRYPKWFLFSQEAIRHVTKRMPP